jgi:adenosylhomocysteine nucleosidase
MRILLVAADRMEFRGAMDRAAAIRRTAIPVDWARFALLGGNEVLMAANGVGWERAAAAVDAARAVFAPERLVSIGFCGALDPGLPPAAVVVASQVLREDGRTLPACPVESTFPSHRGVVCSAAKVAESAAAKRNLRASGAIAVEMEAAGVAGRAQTLGIPFHCIRAVTDLAGEGFDLPFQACLRQDGHFDTMRLLRAALRHPLVRGPELLRLRQRSIRAARALGDFLADCRY